MLLAMAGVDVDAAELAREVENLRDQQRAVSSVLRAVARADGLQPVLEQLVDECVRLCEAEGGVLYLVEDGLLKVSTELSHSEALAYDSQHPHALDRTTVAGRTAVERQPVQIPDILADAEYTYGGPRPFRTLLGVPVMIEDDLIGVVALWRAEPRAFTDANVVLVETFADQAAIALQNARLIDAVERQSTELSRFVSPQVAGLITSTEGEALLAGHRAYISCLFCDLRGFTSFAEAAAPEEMLALLREYHGMLGTLVPDYEGTLEHFAGDGVMVFFNDPLPVANHELQAIRLALAAQERLAELTETWRKRGFELGLGIGIEAGYATLGRIGFEGRYDYGALGPVTSFASRLSTAATHGQVLIGPRVFADVERDVLTAPAGKLELKGFGRSVDVYEVQGMR
jgi:class 3 adenylate cyclase